MYCVQWNALPVLSFSNKLIQSNLSLYVRCGVDETVNIYTSHQPNVKFSMEAFKFIGQYDQVRMDKNIQK